MALDLGEADIPALRGRSSRTTRHDYCAGSGILRVRGVGSRAWLIVRLVAQRLPQRPRERRTVPADKEAVMQEVIEFVGGFWAGAL